MNGTRTRGLGRWAAAAGVAIVLSGGALLAQTAGEKSDEPQQTTTTMPTQGELLRALREDRRASIPIPPTTPPDMPGMEAPSNSIQPARPPDETSALLPEGSFIVDRPGRLIREEDWWTFVYESSDGKMQQAPLRLLPSRQVELMEQSSAAGTRSIVFLVSGEVTTFHGRNYLLVRKVLIRRDYGNLRN